MRNPLKALELNERDNMYIAFAKGGTKALIKGVIGVGAIYGTVTFIISSVRK